VPGVVRDEYRLAVSRRGEARPILSCAGACAKQQQADQNSSADHTGGIMRNSEAHFTRASACEIAVTGATEDDRQRTDWRRSTRNVKPLRLI